MSRQTFSMLLKMFASTAGLIFFIWAISRLVSSRLDSALSAGAAALASEKRQAHCRKCSALARCQALMSPSRIRYMGRISAMPG